MTNEDFWTSIQGIIANDFMPEDLALLDRYAEQFISGRIVYKRFSPSEQYGCATGGATHVIASLLAAASFRASGIIPPISDFKIEQQCAEAQAICIEHWAKKVGCWIVNPEEELTELCGEQVAEGGEAHVFYNRTSLLKVIGLDYYIQPILALDRISLHNAYFPETRLRVIGFGRNGQGEFQIIVEQPFIAGSPMTEFEIQDFAESLGFKLMNPRNWTYATPAIYLSDLHDENVIRSKNGAVYVIDCDIGINTPELRQGGVRQSLTDVIFAK